MDERVFAGVVGICELGSVRYVVLISGLGSTVLGVISCQCDSCNDHIK